MVEPRRTQIEALEFMWQAMCGGYEDIVVSAPTGVGKTGIGTALTMWGAALHIKGYQRGGYYLVTQKMLQDQLEADFPKFQRRFCNRAASIKSATEFICPQYGNCGLGSKMKEKETRCAKRLGNPPNCPYIQQYIRFVEADAGVTNYPYFFTEHLYVDKLKPRNVLVADECHTLEKQITSFVEVCVNHEILTNWAPSLQPVRRMADIETFCNWLDNDYITVLASRLAMLNVNMRNYSYKNRKINEEFNKLDQHIARTKMAVQNMRDYPDEWVYWQEEVKGELESTAKPISAVPFMNFLIKEMAATRLYLSAYMGPKNVFCRSLGLEPAKVAWLELDSTFHVEQRPIHLTTVGSMSRNYINQTMPHLLTMCSTILDSHANEKGIIHTHTYALGKQIYEHLRWSKLGDRVLFPSRASERKTIMEQHRQSAEPTVIISPSISEGYSFDDDLARFQIIAKVPYPYLGDRQVKARMDADREWYTLETVKTVIQACGRIVRSETDHGDTYILDADFLRLYEENHKFFPTWFRAAFKFY
jgi:ATP-dependent DNA helicase DinG